MNEINLEIIEAAESALRKHIQQNEKRIDCLRKLETLTGKYVTKRLNPLIAEMFPEFEYHDVCKQPYGHMIEIRLTNPGWDYWRDDFHFQIADSDGDRRIKPELIQRQIENYQQTNENLKNSLERFRDSCAQLNNLLAYARTLSGPIIAGMHELDGNYNPLKYQAESILNTLNHI